MIQRVFIKEKMRLAMEKYDEHIAFLSGIVGSALFINFADINWQTAWQNIGQLLWLGFVALFSGAMGVLGKHLISKIIKKKNKQS